MAFKCCNYLKHGLFFSKNAIYTCPNLFCMNSDDKIIANYHGELQISDKIVDYKRKKIQEFKDGKIPECCQNCSECREDDWNDTISINQYVFNHWIKCSGCDCVYCETTYNPNYFNSYKEYKILPILSELFEKGLLSFDGYVAFWGGEITELDELDEIADFFLKNNQRYYHVQTSGVVYSQAIERFLKNGFAEICVTIDSGDRDTYKLVKQKDKFNEVWENIKKYIRCKKEISIVSSKFVICPEKNDSQKQVEKWLQKCLENKITKVVLDLDGRFLACNMKRIPKSVLEIKNFVDDFCKKNGMQYEIYGCLFDFLNNIGIKYEVLQSNTIKREYLSCEDFSHSLCFTPEGLRHCMYVQAQFAPPVIPVSDSFLLNPDFVFECKEEIETKRMNGNISDYCKNCFMSCKKIHKNQRFISKIQISHKLDCNADCDFCYNQFVERKYTPYKILPQIKQFKGYYKNGCELFFGGGEPTIWDEFEDIIDFALQEDFTNISISSNGSVFSEKLAEAIKARKVQLVISTDIADSELFEKIKGLDFNTVVDNIKKYLACDKYNQITCKMVILPFVNDSEERIEQWVNFHSDLGVKRLALDIEANYFLGNRGYISPKFKHLLQFAEDKIAEKGLECNLYSFAQQMKHDNSKL